VEPHHPDQLAFPELRAQELELCVQIWCLRPGRNSMHRGKRSWQTLHRVAGYASHHVGAGGEVAGIVS
jgi:hypothetical protein